MSLYDISLKAAVFLVCALFCGGLYFLALVLFKVPSSKTPRAIRQIGPRNRPTPDGISQLYNNAAQFLSKILPMSKYREQKQDLNDPNQQAAAQQDTREQVKREPIRAEKTVGRNDPCPCGSGKKYKNCHGKNM